MPPEPIVSGREPYTPAQLGADLRALLGRYPFIQRRIIGYSVLGRPIWALGLGENPRRTVFYSAAHHANEWLTSPLLTRFAEAYAEAVATGQPLAGQDVASLYRGVTVWLVPQVDPDGVELVIRGPATAGTFADDVVRWNGRSTNFRRWKANIRGVDLNRQYPADWAEVAAAAPTSPSYRDFPGPRPLSEPEAAAMAAFTRRLNPRLVIAYHSQGRVIFWNFKDLAPPDSRQLAAELARLTGYRAEAQAYQPGRPLYSAAGYKDWFIAEFRRPGFTVEVGLGQNPLLAWQFSRIWAENLPAMLFAAGAA